MTVVVTDEVETVVVEDETVTVVSTGTQGPPGPGLGSTDQLPEGLTNRYDRHFELDFTGESTVTVDHNLGKYPAVTVIDSAGDEVFADVDYTGLNQLIVTFGVVFSGKVICN